MASLAISYIPRLINGPPFAPNETMKFEAMRLRTFSTWPSYDRASPIYLAKAGFYYTGNDDHVKCFICQVTKGGWNRSLSPLHVHREISPDCAFVQEMENVNLAMFVPSQNEYDEIQQNLHRQYCGTDESYISSSNLPNQLFDTSDPTSTNYRVNVPPPNFPVVATDAGAAETSRQAIGVRDAFGRDSEAAPTREEFAPMKQEAKRFASFDATWPRDDTPDPRDLARAGFYYTGTVDRVQCAFCRGILRNWEEDDVPMEEHRRHFPMCPFVMGLEVGNITDPTAIISANRANEFMNVTQPVVSDASLGIVTERPKHAQYAVEAARVNSYRNWPSGKEQTPEMLSKAGFFYAGFGDSVKCFFCDGGLRTWEHGDDPWMEHAKWFPKCPYVRQVKGEDFIKAARGGETPSSTARSSSSTPGPSSETSIKSRPIDPRELSSRMDSPIVQTVLNMDIPRDLIARVIRRRLQETGDDFPTVEALMDAIFQENNESASTSTSTSASAVGPQPPSRATSPQSAQPPQTKPFNSEVSVAAGAKDDSTTHEKMVEGEESLGDSDSQSLLQENRELKEQRLCKVCMDEEVNVVFLPCGHLVCCATCAPALPKCPICRAPIRGTVRTFMS